MARNLKEILGDLTPAYGLDNTPEGRKAIYEWVKLEPFVLDESQYIDDAKLAAIVKLPERYNTHVVGQFTEGSDDDKES